jgi:hypothetical protein
VAKKQQVSKLIPKYQTKQVVHEKLFYTRDIFVNEMEGKLLLDLLSDPNDSTVSYRKMGSRSKYEEVIYGYHLFRFPVNGQPKKQLEGLEYFNMVRRQAIKFIERNPNFELPVEYPQEYFVNNRKFKKVAMAHCDLKHAYWRIAFLLGVIDKKLYDKVWDNETSHYKRIRLQSLAVLGQPKTYMQYVNGRPTGEIHYFGGDQRLRDVYTLIRLTCYQYMMKAGKILGKDNFIGYKTDGIFFVDTKENLAKLTKYFNREKLIFRAEELVDKNSFDKARENYLINEKNKKNLKA